MGLRIVGEIERTDGEGPSSLLQTAHAHLSAGRSVPALEALLEAWRAHPASEVADLIDGVSHQITRSLTPLRGTNTEVHALWLNLAATRDAANLGRLLPVCGSCGATRLRQRLELLQTYPRDPRVVAPVLRTVTDLRTAATQPLWSMALELSAKINDGRALAILDDLLSKILEPRRGDSFDVTSLTTRVAKTRKRIGPCQRLSGAERSVVQRCINALGRLANTPAPSEAALFRTRPARQPPPRDAGACLLEAILEAPDDDGARQVYGDWLLEQEDPRGELIALHYKGVPLSVAEKRRERALLKAHARLWTRPIDDVLKPGRFNFARGFLDSCSVRFQTERQRTELIGHSMWRTVREIETTEMALLTHPCMRSMRRATLTGAALSVLARREQPVPLEAAIGALNLLRDERIVPTRVGARLAEQWADALAIGALVHLRAVSVELFPGSDGSTSDSAQLDWLTTSPLDQQLEQLEVRTRTPHSISGWIHVMSTHANLRRVLIRVRPDEELFVLEREGALLRLRLQTRGNLFRPDEARRERRFQAIFRNFPSPQVPHLSLEYVPKESTPMDWRPFDRLYTRFSTIDFTDRATPVAI